MRNWSWYALRPLLGLLPGVPQLRDRRRVTGLLLLLPALAAAAVVVWFTTSPLELLLSPVRLVVLLAAVLVTSGCMLASSATSWPDPEPRAVRIGAHAVAAVLAVLPLAGTVWLVVPQLAVSRSTFVVAPTAVPGRLPPGTPAAVTAAATVGTTDGMTVPEAPIAPVVEARRVNVLLLGGDAGPGRWSLRTDSMNLVSIDASTGDSAIIGIPRNLLAAPMPDGVLRETFPRGFTNLINAVYTWGAARPELVVEALGPTEEPGASLITAVVSELTGQHIDAFVLVDMQGFIEVVDALGGVDVFVPKDLPAPGNVPGGKHPVRDMRQGWNRMDGTDALSFVRSRSADSDYWRMGRQRCALASLAAQKSTVDVARSWPSLGRVIAERVRTNLTPELLGILLASVGTDPADGRSLALVPPLVPSKGWDLAAIHAQVRDTIHGSPSPSDDPPSTTDTVAPAGAKALGVKALGEECRLRP